MSTSEKILKENLTETQLKTKMAAESSKQSAYQAYLLRVFEDVQAQTLKPLEKYMTR